MSTTIKKVFVDNSGSTNGSINYWKHVTSLVDQHKDAIFYFWNSTLTPTTYAKVKKNAAAANGDGGTHPCNILPQLHTNDTILIITDGEIDKLSVQKCLNKVPPLKYLHYACIGPNADLSVGAPFISVAKTYILTVNEDVIASGSGVDEINLDHIDCTNPAEFMEKHAQNLRSSVIMQCLTSANTRLRDRLVQLSQALQLAVAQQNSLTTVSTMQHLENVLLSDGTAAEAAWNAVLNETVDTSLGACLQSYFNELFQACDGNQGFSIARLRSSVDRAAETSAVPVVGLPLPVQDVRPVFECPILLDTDFPVLCIRQGTPIFDGFTKADMEYYLNNPLAVLNNTNLKNALCQRFDNALGFESAQQLFAVTTRDATATVTSPMTRLPLVGFISTVGDEQTHNSATNFTLSCLFFPGNKLVGCIDLWLAVVCLACESVTYLNSDDAFMNAMRNLLQTRMRNSNTNMTLSGLPILPQLRCRTDIAVYHCIMSPFAQCSNNNTIDNRLRYFGASATHWLRLARWLQLPIREQESRTLQSWYGCFAWMMLQEKDNTNWRSYLRLRYQNHWIEPLTKTCVFLDGPPSDELLSQSIPQFPFPGYDSIPLNVLITLAAKVDRTKTTAAITDIALTMPLLSVPTAVYNYPTVQTVHSKPIYICPSTLRPYLYDKFTNRPWAEEAVALYGPLTGPVHQLSGNKYLIEFVNTKNVFPTVETLVMYMASRESNRLEYANDTLPENVVAIATDLIERYHMIGAFQNVDEFNRITTSSRNIDTRAMLEQQWHN